jgi:peptide/nickel transport system permease protein
MASISQELDKSTAGVSTASKIFTVIKRGIRGFLGLNPRFLFGLTLLILLLIFGFLGPTITGKTNPKAFAGSLYDAPSANAWLGTDNFGYDVFTQLMFGTQTSLKIGFIAGTIATLIGLLIGTVAGFVGGIVEEVLMAFTNIVITIPSIVILILLSIAFSVRSIWVMGFIIGITAWPWTARAVRAQTSSLRTREHVDIARLSGAGTLSLIIWEIIPYMLSYIVMAFVLQLNSGILQEAALSMLGLGIARGVSLGIMLQWSLLYESVRTGAWWAFFPPTIFLTLIAFSLLLLQSSIDSVFNPRLRKN